MILLKQKTKNKLIICLSYLLSLCMFNMVGAIKFLDRVQLLADEGYGGPMLGISMLCVSGVYHFIFVTIIAIYVAFSNKINKDYKTIFYFFPLITFFISPLICALMFRLYVTIATFFGY